MAPSTRAEWLWLYRECRPFLRYHIGSLTCIAASGAAGLVPPLLMKWLIDDVLPNRRWGALVTAAGLLLASHVGKAGLAALGTFVNTVAVKRMIFALHLRLVRRVQSLSAEFHARHPLGDLLQRLERDALVVGDFTSDVLPVIARTIVGTLMAIATMVYLDWRLSSVALPLLPAFIYARHRYRTKLRQSAEAVRDASGRQSSLLHEILFGAVQIQLLGAQGRIAREYTRLGLTTIQRELLQRRREAVYTVVSRAIIALATALIIGYGSVRVLSGELTAGALVAFYGYIGSIFTPMTVAVGLFARMIRMQTSVRRLIEIEQPPDVVEDAPDATPLTSAPRVIAWGDVTFDHAPGKRVLHRVRLRASAGERIAVVGESGAGKSSLLKLVPRLYDPTAGGIHIDGRDIRSFRLESLRQAISFVPQDPVLFQGTLRANVRHGCPAASPDEIAEAARIACFTEVVERLHHGWDTELGRMGAGLSGGERQRLAIARALLQRRPILILDEAFSALDSAAERRLLSRLEGWAKGRILILVSHRLAAAQWADRVIVLRGGQVVEDASHDLLYRDGTYYSALWRCRDQEVVTSR
jgi:subfamily B ATP-binding cassette protein MsbA